MVDFTKLVKEKRRVEVTNLATLFESLDRQTSHIEMRPSQRECLELLTLNRENKDLILKISTGAGKTAIGLLYLLSFMEEYKKPVVYLCPTKQLVGQVLSEADKLGINAVSYPAGTSHPDVDGISGKAIIVCTYDKLFNAKSTFNRYDVMLRPISFVLDDAHAGIEIIRDAFTLSIEHGELYNAIIKLLSDPCKQNNSVAWREIELGDPTQIYEIPYWIWINYAPQLEDIIATFSEENEEHQFVLPYLLDLLPLCRSVISGNRIEIIPLTIPIHKCEAYNTAAHRLFMSATLADDSVLISEMGCDPNAAKNLITPINDRGLGERMVLAPSLVDESTNRKWLMQICAAASKHYSVVVLAPSEKRAREWEPYGATVYMSDSVTSTVNALKSGQMPQKFTVFVQRYDGIDLPDNSCRILVLDGIPVGEGLIDRYDSNVHSVAAGARNRLVYRIEQGMGRAVRSHADFAVILLSGLELATFIAKHDIVMAMHPDTKSQLNLALDLAKIAQDDQSLSPHEAIIDMMNKCLRRDEGWKQFYAENIRSVEKKALAKTEEARISFALAERSAFEAALAEDFESAVKFLRFALNSNAPGDDKTKARYLQLIGNYLYKINEAEAFNTQREAYKLNTHLNCPPITIKRPVKIKTFNVQERIRKWFKQFDNPNGALTDIEKLRTQLSLNQKANIVERAICDLSKLLGAKGSMPERELNEGPDDLWLWPNLSLVIEVKNQNEESLHAKDAGQLHRSLQWFKNSYAARDPAIPLVVAKVTKIDLHSDFPDGTVILSQQGINKLLDNLKSFYRRWINDPIFYSTSKTLVSLQSEYFLLPEQFLSTFTHKA